MDIWVELQTCREVSQVEMETEAEKPERILLLQPLENTFLPYLPTSISECCDTGDIQYIQVQADEEGYELSTLCDCNITLIIFSSTQLFQNASSYMNTEAFKYMDSIFQIYTARFMNCTNMDWIYYRYMKQPGGSRITPASQCDLGIHLYSMILSSIKVGTHTLRNSQWF